MLLITHIVMSNLYTTWFNKKCHDQDCQQTGEQEYSDERTGAKRHWLE